MPELTEDPPWPDAWDPLCPWAPRDVRVYFLEIAYPPGSMAPGWRPRRWTAAEGARFLGRRHKRELRRRQFRWPRERMFLSASGAYGRAGLLHMYGATVRVHRSHAVLWPGRYEYDTEFDPTGLPRCGA